MRGRLAPTALVILLAIVSGVACRGEGRGGLAVSFDVSQLPPEPPAPPPPPPEPVPDPVPGSADGGTSAPVESAPSPQERIRILAARLKPVYFETGLWDLTEEGRARLSENAAVLLEGADLRATVEGHADERGSESYNQALGIWRAKTVKDLLRTLGIPQSRLTILSHGKKKPAASGKESEALRMNRRVEIVLKAGP